MDVLIVGNRLLGDSLDSLPALLLLTRYFNKSNKANIKFILLSYRYSVGVYSHSQGINFKGIHLIDEANDYLTNKGSKAYTKTFTIIKQYLRLIIFAIKNRRKYEGVILFPGGFGWGIFAYLLCGSSRATHPISVGHGHDWRSALLSQSVPYYTAIANYENFLNLVYAFINKVKNPTSPFLLTTPNHTLSPLPAEQSELINYLKNDISNILPSAPSALNDIVPNRKNWVVIAPTASEEHKTWPAPYFYELATHITASGYHIAWVGLEREREVIDAIRRGGTSPSSGELNASNQLGENLAGKFTLPELFGFIKTAHIFIGNDSGLAHAATMLGTATVVIYGPGNPILSRPFTQQDAKLIQIYVDFGISAEERRHLRYRKTLAMENLTPSQVWEQVKKI